MGIAAALALLLSAPFGLAASKQNAAADRVVELSRALGIDFDEKNEKSPHPAAAEVEAYHHSGAGAWLNAQIQSDSDEIAEPPVVLRDFLHDRSEVLWSVIAALEKSAPEWNSASDENGTKHLLPVIRLQKILLAASLVEERRGNWIDAGRALEASWSLGRAITSSLIDQLLAVSIERWQVGVLRKLKEPPLQWMARLSGDRPWRGMLDAVATDHGLGLSADALESSDPWSELTRSVPGAIASGIRNLSPCEASLLSEEEAWNFAEHEIPTAVSPEAIQIRAQYREMVVPGLMNGIQRAGRLEVDRELTLKILHLRLERDAARDGRWPEKLLEATSAACPAVSYGYRSGKDGMEVRFEGTVYSESTGAVLPLRFRSGTPIPAPTSTPAPTLTAPPEGGMIPPQ
jgi:hypothetical protein